MKTFTLTEEHVKLLRRMYVEWWDCEFGAPCIDPKRPYGNSDVVDDVAEILEIGGDFDADIYGESRLSDTQHDQCVKLHKETQTALQVVLASGSFEPGDYVVGDYGIDWKRVAS